MSARLTWSQWLAHVGGVRAGWDIPRHDKAAIQCLVDLLKKIVIRKRGTPVLAMLEDVQEAIAVNLVGRAIEKTQLLS